MWVYGMLILDRGERRSNMWVNFEHQNQQQQMGTLADCGWGGGGCAHGSQRAQALLSEVYGM